MRTFTAGFLGLAFLPITACTDSHIDTANLAASSSLAAEESSLTSMPKSSTTADDEHDEHSAQASHESHATASRQSSEAHHMAGIEIGQVVPDFEVTIDGKSRKFTELQKDKTLTEDGTISVYVLVFVLPQLS